MSFVQASVDPRRLRARAARSRRTGLIALAVFVLCALAASLSPGTPGLLILFSTLSLIALAVGLHVLTADRRRLYRRLGAAGENAVVSADAAGITLPATGLVPWAEIELLYVMTTRAGTARAEDAVIIFVRDGESYRARVTTPRTASLVHVTRRASGSSVAMLHTPPGSIFGEGQVLALQNTIAVLAQHNGVRVLRSDEGHALPGVVQLMAAG